MPSDTATPNGEQARRYAPGDVTAAHEANRRLAAERAAADPAKLAKAARIFKIALARGLVTPDGELVDGASDGPAGER